MANLEMIRKMLKPSTPTPNHLRTLKLSFFDQLAFPVYVPVLFYYLPSVKISCDKLQKSLAETLTKFYPLAGRFSEDDDELSIHCNDEGVEYIESKVNMDLAEFLRTEHAPKIDLLPEMDHRPSSPLLGIQVNLFNCGGLVIGTHISHKIADAFTLATFVKESAHTSLTGTLKAGSLPSFGNLSSLFPTRVLSGTTQFPSYIINTTRPKIVTRRFIFDALAIANLKNTIEDSTDIRPTRVVLIMSLIWKVLVGISTAKNGHSRNSSLLFLINLRGKSNLPSLDNDALGNCTMIGIANMEARKDELNDFVKLVGNTIRDTCVAIGKAESVDDISSLVVNNHRKVIEKFAQGDEIDVYPSTSWCRFCWYEADFGWGKPFWVSLVECDAFEGISLMDTKDGDGIEAWVSLKENDMAQFERDPNILSSTSKLAFHSFG
ncbi:acetyl-CoA-benzylalcohol acetyltransferase-like [Solanum verrucosum]|uniref:acetyl-CoA-benzylalcohol acetyltransferase-like n=1 Tax=Solanum verrucosum TaxID=315347 RepID=UPI0020D14575|nr:acetyl-CoA-benzylalcohol acetyltransferase-like [Solanum verrucosum]